MAFFPSSVIPLLLFIFLLTLRDQCQGAHITDPPPPVWPATFQANFTELMSLFSVIPISHNNGSWFYDYPRRRARYDRTEGQIDYFCRNQGLSNDSHGPCQLMFSNDTRGSLFVHYPKTRRCCRLCGAAEGCTVLRPDWLKGATYVGQKTVGGIQCHGWQEQGSVVVDSWYVTANGTPCEYFEKLYIKNVIPIIWHWMDFDPHTFRTGPIDENVFQIPSYCHTDCPNPFKVPKNGNWLKYFL